MKLFLSPPSKVLVFVHRAVEFPSYPECPALKSIPWFNHRAPCCQQDIFLMNFPYAVGPMVGPIFQPRCNFSSRLLLLTSGPHSSLSSHRSSVRQPHPLYRPLTPRLYSVCSSFCIFFKWVFSRGRSLLTQRNSPHRASLRVVP